MDFNCFYFFKDFPNLIIHEDFVSYQDNNVKQRRLIRLYFIYLHEYLNINSPGSRNPVVSNGKENL